jgi:hypothetical protein
MSRYISLFTAIPPQVLSANSANFLKLRRLGQLPLEQLVHLTPYSYVLDDKKRTIIAIVTSPSDNNLFIAPTHTDV